uniref:BTB domain-containing protein n=1 Tax=Panagrellus redivivus TaxID=6233 RepID=A0A7E4WAI3_PANRE
MYDGPISFFSTWDSVVFVDTTSENQKPIIVTDTLSIYCKNAQDYEKVIPYISGTYSRLSIRGGFITLDQVKRLIHPDVKQVHLLAEVCVRSLNDDDNLIQYLTQFLTTPEHRFAFRRHEWFQPSHRQRLKDTFTDHSHGPYFLHRVICMVDRRSANTYFHAYAFLMSICLFGACICPLFDSLRIAAYAFAFIEVFMFFFAIFLFLLTIIIDHR